MDINLPSAKVNVITRFAKGKDKKNMVDNFKIAGGHKDTVDSASNVLKEGGNAFDAAIAGVFASMSCEYLYTGAASGGAMLVKKNGFSADIIDFFVETPPIDSSKVKDFKAINADFGNTKQEFNIGAGSVGIPGTLPGLIQIHKEYGSLPFSVLVEQAIDLSKKGCLVSKNQEYLSEVLFPIISSSKVLESLFIKDGSLLKEGDLFFNAEFASFLNQFLYEDAATFYKHEVCPLFYNSFKAGGIIELKNLQEYTPKKRAPLELKYCGHQIFMNPQPSTGGTLINAGLKQLSGLDVVSKQDIEGALHKIKNFKDQDMVGSTTHLSVIDKENNVASVTTTNGVGAGFTVPGTGIMPNNMLGEKHLNMNGFHNWKSRQRIPSNICPTLIIDKNNNLTTLGSAGSSRIISATISVISNLLHNEMSLKRSISKSRIHLEGDTLHCEPSDNHPKYKTKNVVVWGGKNMYFGGVNACSSFESVGDERRSGVSV
jgi:gamma-glutamyltranspeptidase/glutathione hydrolase